MSNCKPVKISISLGIANSLTHYKNQVEKSIVTWYQSVVRALMWLAIHACPDLAYWVGVLNQFCNNPGHVHLELVKQLLRYVSRILVLSLKFDGEADTPDDVVRYMNSDFARSKTNRKSTGDYIFMIAEAAIHYLSKLQFIVALLTNKVEYITMCEAGKEAAWLGYLLAKLGFQKKFIPVTLYTNNQSSIALSNNPKFHHRTKYIYVRFYWICEVLSIEQLQIIYVPTTEMSDDGLIKALPVPTFLEFWRIIDR